MSLVRLEWLRLWRTYRLLVLVVVFAFFGLLGPLTAAYLPEIISLASQSEDLGAAIDLAVGLGLHPSFETAVQEMTRVRDTFDPNPDNRRLYDELYQRVYRKMYKRLKPLYEDIRKITGYPKPPE